jgi:hypothetical protein
MSPVSLLLLLLLRLRALELIPAADSADTIRCSIDTVDAPTTSVPDNTIKRRRATRDNGNRNLIGPDMRERDVVVVEDI